MNKTITLDKSLTNKTNSAPDSDSKAHQQSAALIKAENFSFFYGSKAGVKDVTIDIYQGKVTAIIGPSGCGKSTFLRSINRMNDLIPNTRTEGVLSVNGNNIYDKRVNLVNLRQQVGMVFQRPNPFAKSIYDNIAFGPRLQGISNSIELDEIVESCLRGAAIWDEVKDDLKKSALALSGGQQQRLCIARTLATKPRVVLMDEPCSALDPVATARIEDLITELKEKYTIVIVTHNMQQAARVSEYTAFFCMGDLVEYGLTDQLFTNPVQKSTEDYITGRFG
ncbi:Phosphate import ATP-binding protein PstB 3 [Limihaloglobus sulfuriphilus]|uniref:Phosphate import ATP-binding protein PstB 3 n=1 Tax=Limihaloglobus sulfuriphilus TaxID=1851148 RepID=A0A1R7T654_9BACT|nr:phosphate ABC transporter ATP-binding protein PstB [Limihaloglobus sulfuriphilus]AQQ72336.1 Phosphate import ATP-binding protein PstB 3 [Limihaloglobus sulfuriphilus]